MGAGAATMSGALSDTAKQKRLVLSKTWPNAKERIWARLAGCKVTDSTNSNKCFRSDELQSTMRNYGVPVTKSSVDSLVLKYGVDKEKLDYSGFCKWFDDEESGTVHDRETLCLMAVDMTKPGEEVKVLSSDSEELSSPDTLEAWLGELGIMTEDWGNGESRSVTQLLEELSEPNGSTRLLKYQYESHTMAVREVDVLVVWIVPTSESYRASSFVVQDPVLTQAYIRKKGGALCYPRGTPILIRCNTSDIKTEDAARKLLSARVDPSWRQTKATFDFVGNADVPPIVIHRASSSYPSLQSVYLLSELVVKCDLPPWGEVFDASAGGGHIRTCSWASKSQVVSLFDSELMLSSTKAKEQYEYHPGGENCSWCEKREMQSRCALMTEMFRTLCWEKAFVKKLGGGKSGAAVISAKGIEAETGEESLKIIKIDGLSGLRSEMLKHTSAKEMFSSLADNVPGGLALVTSDEIGMEECGEDGEEDFVVNEGEDEVSEGEVEDEDALEDDEECESEDYLTEDEDEDEEKVHDSEVEEEEEDDGGAMAAFAMELTGGQNVAMSGLGVTLKVSTLADLIHFEQKIELGRPSDPIGIQLSAMQIIRQVCNKMLKEPAMTHVVEGGEVADVDMYSKVMKRLKRFVFLDVKPGKRTTPKDVVDSLEAKYGLVTACKDFEESMKGSEPVAQRRGFNHGDLNSKNVMIDQSQDIWLIDFAHWGIHHAITDLVKIESCLMFEYLVIDDEHMESAEKLVRALYSTASWDDDWKTHLDSAMKDSPKHFQNIVDIVIVIREFAQSYLENFSSHSQQVQFYYQALIQYPKILMFDDIGNNRVHLAGLAVCTLAASVKELLQNGSSTSVKSGIATPRDATVSDISLILETFANYVQYLHSKFSVIYEDVSSKQLDTLSMFASIDVGVTHDEECSRGHCWDDIIGPLMSALIQGDTNMPSGVFLYGRGGTGKTVFMKQAILHLASQQPRSFPDGGSRLIVPYWFDADRLGKMRKSDLKNPIQIFDRIVARQFGKFAKYTKLWNWAKEHAAVTLVLLIDGVDQVQKKRQDMVADLLKNLAKTSEKGKILTVISMRCSAQESNAEFFDSEELAEEVLGDDIIEEEESSEEEYEEEGDDEGGDAAPTPTGSFFHKSLELMKSFFDVMELLPLRRSAVEEIAYANLGSSTNNFLKGIYGDGESESSLGDIASNPYKLSLLVNLFQRDNVLPANQGELMVESTKLDCKRFAFTMKGAVRNLYDETHLSFFSMLATSTLWKWRVSRNWEFKDFGSKFFTSVFNNCMEKEAPDTEDDAKSALLKYFLHSIVTGICPFLEKPTPATMTFEVEEEFNFLIARDFVTSFRGIMGDEDAPKLLDDLTSRGYKLQFFDITSEDSVSNFIACLLSDDELKRLVFLLTDPLFAEARSFVNAVQLLIQAKYDSHAEFHRKDVAFAAERSDETFNALSDEQKVYDGWLLLSVEYPTQFGQARPVAGSSTSLRVPTKPAQMQNAIKRILESQPKFYELYPVHAKYTLGEGADITADVAMTAAAELRKDDAAPSPVLRKIRDAFSKSGDKSMEVEFSASLVSRMLRSNFIDDERLSSLEKNVKRIVRANDPVQFARAAKPFKSWQKRNQSKYYDAAMYKKVSTTIQKVIVNAKKKLPRLPPKP